MNKNMEWLNSNSQRNYPIKENATRQSVDGNFVLPNQFVLDAVFVTNTQNEFHIQKVNVFDDIINIVIRDDNGVLVTTLSIDVPTHTENDFYVIVGQGIYQHLQGKIVLGNLQRISDTVLGSFEFSFEATKFEDTVVIPSIRGVDSIIVGEVALVDDVILESGFNFRIRTDIPSNTIFFDAIDGAGLGPFCECEDDRVIGEPITSINGIPADADGNFNIQGIDCIEVNGVNAGFVINNTCQEVCCGCSAQTEIDALEARIEQAVVQATALLAAAAAACP